jgi:LysM repeat protein
LWYLKGAIVHLRQHISKFLRQGLKNRVAVKVGAVALSLAVMGVGSVVVGGGAAYAADTVSCNGTVHTVQSGETLSGIGARNHVSWPQLASYNHIANPNLIFVDQKICIPKNINQASYQSQSTTHQPANPATSQVAQAPAAGGSVEAMIYQAFGSDANSALNVARCESGLNPNATNAASGAAGLFQFLPSTWRTTSQAGQSPYNAYANILAAHEVFVRDGHSWREWSCQP